MVSKNNEHEKSRRGRRMLALGFAFSVLGLTGAGVYAGRTATAGGTSGVTSGTPGGTMVPENDERKKRKWGRRVLALGFAVSVLGLTGAGVYAGLTATAGSTSSVTSGTLLMTLTADGTSSGLPETVSAMAPGDVYNVYVDVNNTGSLASAAGMTLGAAASPANALTNGSITGEGLSVSITQCSVAWSSGSCSGTSTTILSSTAVSSVVSSAQSLSNVPALAASSGELAHLQFSVTLAGTETSNNGTLPSQTVQGLNTTITWTFTETQRTAATTNN